MDGTKQNNNFDRGSENTNHAYHREREREKLQQEVNPCSD
jgi:hypothetical protein